MTAKSKIQPEFIETGTTIGDLFVLEDVGGNPALPPIDGSQVTGIVATAFQINRVISTDLTIPNNRVELQHNPTILDGVVVRVEDGGKLLIL